MSLAGATKTKKKPKAFHTPSIKKKISDDIYKTDVSKESQLPGYFFEEDKKESKKPFIVAYDTVPPIIGDGTTEQKRSFDEPVIDLNLIQRPAEKSETLDESRILFYMTKNIGGKPHHGAAFASEAFMKAGIKGREADAETYNELVSKGMKTEEAFWRAYLGIKD